MEFGRTSIPEDKGVNSNLLLEFFNKLDELGIDRHGLVLIKDDNIIIENYTAPFSNKYAHALFSGSKGFISTAVSFAIADGKMTLDTPILEYFPEYKKQAEKEPRNALITIRQLLTMTSGKKSSFIKNMTKTDYADDWIKYKFRDNDDFLYSNDDVYILAKAISRIYGMSIVDFLMPRLFIPLGIEKPFWEHNAEGYESAATGLYIKTLDWAKVAYCYLNNGKYGNKQVIPKEWTEICGEKHIKLPDFYETSKDYGYYFWCNPDCGYRFDGMFGQLAYIFPKHKAVLVIHSSTCKEFDLIKTIYEYFPKAFETSSDGSQADKLLTKLAESTNYELPINERSSKEKDISKYIYSLGLYQCVDIIGYPLSMIPMSVNTSFAQKAKHTLNNLSFEFKEWGATLSWNEGKEFNNIEIGMDGKYRESLITLGNFKFTILSYAYWEDDKTLNIEIRPIETPSRRYLKIKFGKHQARIKFTAVPSMRSFALGHMDEVMYKPSAKIVTAMKNFFMELLFKLTEPNLIARAKHKK